MYNQDRLIETVEKYHAIFDDIKVKFLESCSGNNVDFEKWQGSRKNVEGLLKKEIDKIRVATFRADLSFRIKEYKNGKNTGNDCDFDKFCYFIDRLNTEKYNKKILKYNEDYCTGIIKEIAHQYVMILNLLKDKEAHLLKANQKEFDAAKKQLISEWGKMLSECVDKIIEDEYMHVIQEVQNEVYNA